MVELEVPPPTPVETSPGLRRTRRRLEERRRYDPVKRKRRKEGADVVVDEGGWGAALVRFKAMYETVHNGQPSGGSSPEKALAAKIRKFAKAELKRSVSRIVYCVLAPHFANFITPATAAPGYQSWGRSTPKGRGRIPYRHTGRNRPSSRKTRQIERDQ